MRTLDPPAAEGVDPAGAIWTRRLFGGLMVIAIARFIALGWVTEIYTAPATHFTYTGFGWVRAWPAPWMTVHMVVAGLAALAMALDWRPRLAALIFAVLFTYAELISKAAWLNHYYLVSLLAFIFAALPLHRDRRASPWVYTVLRVQVGCVYVFAGLAKLDADWLVRAEPLYTWLQAHADVPLVGGVLTTKAAAFVMSWAGAIFDLLVVPGLLWARTRRLAYLAAVGFHLSIWLLFPVGMFSFIMLIAATVFFAPDWPRRWSKTSAPTAPARAWGKGALAIAGLWLGLQIMLPLRGFLHPGVLNWHAHGYRFAWRVMLVEKTGTLEYRVCSDRLPRCARVRPGPELTMLQRRQLRVEPDMMLQYAHRLGARYRQAGHGAVRVYADAWGALNGRPSQRLIDPAVDLLTLSPWTGPERWIVPLERPD